MGAACCGDPGPYGERPLSGVPSGKAGCAAVCQAGHRLAPGLCPAPGPSSLPEEGIDRERGQEHKTCACQKVEGQRKASWVASKVADATDSLSISSSTWPSKWLFHRCEGSRERSQTVKVCDNDSGLREGGRETRKGVETASRLHVCTHRSKLIPMHSPVKGAAEARDEDSQSPPGTREPVQATLGGLGASRFSLILMDPCCLLKQCVPRQADGHSLLTHIGASQVVDFRDGGIVLEVFTSERGAIGSWCTLNAEQPAQTSAVSPAK